MLANAGRRVDFHGGHAHKLAWTVGGFVFGIVLFMVMLIKPRLPDEAEEILS